MLNQWVHWRSQSSSWGDEQLVPVVAEGMEPDGRKMPVTERMGYGVVQASTLSLDIVLCSSILYIFVFIGPVRTKVAQIT